MKQACSEKIIQGEIAERDIVVHSMPKSADRAVVKPFLPFTHA
jgi:hypothetical protein